jgi:hypothetical protein
MAFVNVLHCWSLRLYSQVMSTFTTIGRRSQVVILVPEIKKKRHHNQVSYPRPIQSAATKYIPNGSVHLKSYFS